MSLFCMHMYTCVQHSIVLFVHVLVGGKVCICACAGVVNNKGEKAGNR